MNQSQLAIPVSVEDKAAMSLFMENMLKTQGSPDGTMYELTNPIRFVQIRSRQTIDPTAAVSTGPTAVQRMFLEVDADTGDEGFDVLTDEPVLIYGEGISTSYVMAHYGLTFETNSADSTPNNARLTQRAMRGARAVVNRTNRTLQGPWLIDMAGDPVNREELIDGGGVTVVDAGVQQADLLTILLADPLLQWPRNEIQPEVQFDGTQFAALDGGPLTQPFQLIWTFLTMLADVAATGSAPAGA